MKYDYSQSGTPQFDPSKPFEEVDYAPPPFDPSKPFEEVDYDPEEEQRQLREAKRKEREPVAKAIASGIGMAAPMVPHQLTEALLLRGGRVGDFAAEAVPSVGGTIAGTAAGGPVGTVVGGAAGSTLGNALAQARQYFRGERDDWSGIELGVAAGTGAIPIEKIPVPFAKKLGLDTAEALAASAKQLLGKRAIQGGLVTTAGEGTRQALEGDFDPWRLVEAGGWGALFGGVAGTPEYLAKSRALTKWVRKNTPYKDYTNTPAEKQQVKNLLEKQARENMAAGAVDIEGAPGRQTAPPVTPETNAEQQFNRLQNGEPVAPVVPEGGVPVSPEIFPTAEAAAAAPVVDTPAAGDRSGYLNQEEIDRLLAAPASGQEQPPAAPSQTAGPFNADWAKSPYLSGETDVTHFDVPAGKWNTAMNLRTNQHKDGTFSVNAHLHLPHHVGSTWYSAHDKEFPQYGYATADEAKQAGLQMLNKQVAGIDPATLSDSDAKLLQKVRKTLGDFTDTPAEAGAPAELPDRADMTREQMIAELKSYGYTHERYSHAKGSPIEDFDEDGLRFRLKQERLKQESIKELQALGIDKTESGAPLADGTPGELGHFAELSRARHEQKASGKMVPPAKPLPAIEDMDTKAIGKELVSYGLGPYLRGIGYRSKEQYGKILADERALRTGKQTPERVSVDDEDAIDAATTPAEQPEKIVSAAARAPDGTIYTGKWHPAAYEKYMEATGATREKVVTELQGGTLADGFLTSTGRFVDRDEAAKVADRVEQFKPGKAGDVAFAGGLKDMQAGPGVVKPPTSTAPRAAGKPERILSAGGVAPNEHEVFQNNAKPEKLNFKVGKKAQPDAQAEVQLLQLANGKWIVAPSFDHMKGSMDGMGSPLTAHHQHATREKALDWGLRSIIRSNESIAASTASNATDTQRANARAIVEWATSQLPTIGPKGQPDLPSVRSMKKKELIAELHGYGITETRTGGFVKNSNAGDLMNMVEMARKKQAAAHLPTEAPTLAPQPASPEATANAADAPDALASAGDVHGVAGSADSAAPAAEIETVFNFNGNRRQRPLGQRKADEITAEQWNEIKHLRKKPDQFKKAFQSKQEANKRLAKAEAKNATSREAVTAKKGPGFRFGRRIDGEIDVIDAIQEVGGVPRPGPERGDGFDEWETYFGQGSAKLLQGGKHKVGKWDGFMQSLVATHPQLEHMRDFRANELGEAVKQALNSRAKEKAGIAKEKQEIRTGQKIERAQERGLPEGAQIDASGRVLQTGDAGHDPNVPFEEPAGYGVQLNEPAESYATLAAKLKQLRLESQSRPLTQQESEALDHLDRTLGQDFMDFYQAGKGEAGAQLGDVDALKRSELQRRMDAPLQGGELGSQLDMLGPTTDKDGQFALFEDAAARYLTHKGVAEPARRAAARDLLAGVWEREMERQLHLQLGADEKLAAGLESISAAGVRSPALSGQLGAPFGEPGLHPTTGGAGRAASSLRLEHRDTVQRFVRDGHLKLIGQKFDSTGDLVEAAQILRNPGVETLWVFPYDKDDRLMAPFAVTSRLPGAVLVGREFEHEIGAYLKAIGAVSWGMLHNHPNGVAIPSKADRIFTAYLAGAVKAARFKSHEVIDHGTYATIDRHGRQTFSLAPNLAGTPDPLRPAPTSPYLGRMFESEDALRALGHELQHPSGNVLINLIGNQGNLRGMASVAVADLDSPDFPQQLAEMGREVGAVHALAYTEDPSASTRGKLAALVRYRTLSQVAYKVDGKIELTENTFKARHHFGTPTGFSELLRVAEDEVPYDPAKPLLILDDKGNVVGAQVLGGLEHVRPVEMPELVQLAREMTGMTPGLKKFPRALGAFYPEGKKGYIKLDRRGFKDPIRVQQTLAHEIGHAQDYQPDSTLERGNLGGRIQSLRQHLTTTFPLNSKSGDAITAKERKDLYQAVGKGLGKRPPKDEDPAGHAAWGEERSRRYKEEIQELIDGRKLTKESVVRAELMDVDQWWSPYDPATVPKSYKAYRESSVELYAQAISVLLNAPKELKERAPVFYQTLFNYMDRKPEVLQQLFDLWTHLYRGKLGVITERNARLAAGFGRGEEIFMRKAAERDAKQNSLQGVIDGAKQKHFDIFSPIIEKARAVKASGRTLPWHQDPEFVFDAHPLADNDNYRLLDRVHKQVVAPLEAGGLTQNDLGLYLFHNRVLNEAYLVGGELTGRTVIANPEGITPIQARQALLEMRLRFGPERMTLLERSARKFQDETFAVIQKGAEAGVYSPENAARAAANRYNYASFAVLDYLEQSGHIPAAIRQQRGTLEAIANPFTASLVKSLTALKLIEHNTNKAVTVKLLAQHFRGEIEAAPVSKIPLASGGYMSKSPPPPSGKEELIVLSKGKPVTYWVEPEIAKMFDRLMPANSHAVIKTLNWTFRNVMYPAFITYNPAFQLYLSPMRDLRRSYVNLPAGVSRRKFLGEQVRTWEAAKSRLLGQSGPAEMEQRRQLRALRKRRPLTPAEREQLDLLDNRALVIETLATRAIGSPFDSFVRNPTREDYFGKLLQEYELLPPDKRAAWKESKFVKPVRTIGEWIERTGMTFEALPKMAAYRVLTRDLGWPAHQAASYVRNHIGVPNYLRRGEWATVDGTVMPFLNVFMQGIASDVKQATGQALGPVNPRTQKFEWWRRMAENTLVPRLLQALAAAGLLGAGLKEIYDGVPEYDKANYTVIPLGLSNQPTESGKRKSVYIRLPEDETARVMAGVMHYLVQKAANDDPAAKASLTDLAAFGGGQVPSLNPVLTLGAGWASYAAGQNPIDQFRGEKVLSNMEFNAGGWTGLRGMLAWSWRETGGANFVRWDPKSNNVAEFTLSSVPGLNRLVKVTDAGHRERQQHLEETFDTRNAQIRAAMPPSVNRLLGEYSGLVSIRAEHRSLEQAYRLKTLSVWHSKVWQPNYEMMQQTTDKLEWKATGKSLGEMSETWAK